MQQTPLPIIFAELPKFNLTGDLRFNYNRTFSETQGRVFRDQNSEGSFFGTYRDNFGNIYFQGGTVTGGNGGSETVENFKIKNGQDWLLSEGDILYLEVSCEATVQDGIMLPGCTVKSASLKKGSSVPDNHSFTTSAKTGSLYSEIARMVTPVLLRKSLAKPTTFHASGCIGNFSLSPF